MTDITRGRYIVAVSGGVDSMVLLDKLRRLPSLDLIVAHVDHGMREDSFKDCELVEDYARRYSLVCITTKLHLGRGVSEEQARKARYAFLQQCRKEYDAAGIITAHHQDDLIETALLAIIRGTGWRGLAPFTSTVLLRPLLDTPKHELIGYARRHHLAWREDSTNADERYTRNYIRHTIIPMLDQRSDKWRQVFLRQIRTQQALRHKIESELTAQLQQLATSQGYPRYTFIMLPQIVAYELLQQLCKQYAGHTYERALVENMLIFIKVARPHKVMELSSAWQIRVTKRDFIVEPRTPVVSYNKH